MFVRTINKKERSWIWKRAGGVHFEAWREWREDRNYVIILYKAIFWKSSSLNIAMVWLLGDQRLLGMWWLAFIAS